MEDMMSGKETNQLVLIFDTVKHRGDCILNHITQGLIDRLDIVILFMFDKHTRNCTENSRLYIYDGFTDLLKWTADKSSSQDKISKPFFIKTILTKSIENDENFNKLLSDKSSKVGIVINSLTTVIAHQNIANLCKDLVEVMNYHTQKFEVDQTVVLIHSDLHDEIVLSSLNYVASTSIELKNFEDEEQCTGHFVTTSCKKSGKMQRKKEAYRIGSDYSVEIIPVDEKKNVDGNTFSENENVISTLTFNLNLTEEQKQARANLQLPYLLDDKTKQTQLNLGKKSQIFYEADEADDIDEEDPDDDLNI